jgi:hypothetical protein
VVLDDAVEDVAADEAKLSVNGGSSTLDKSPLVGFVVGGLRVSVVEVRDGNCDSLVTGLREARRGSSYRSSGSSTNRADRMPAELSSLPRSLKPSRARPG